MYVISDCSGESGDLLTGLSNLSSTVNMESSKLTCVGSFMVYNVNSEIFARNLISQIRLKKYLQC